MEKIIKAIINEHHEIDVANTSALDVIEQGDGEYHVIAGGSSLNVKVLSVDRQTKSMQLLVDTTPYAVSLKDEVDMQVEHMGLTGIDGDTASDAEAPMPGLVVSVAVSAGDAVEQGDPLLILEAMKMENVIKAGVAGTVGEVHVAAGDKVEKGQLLVSFSME